MILRCVNDIKRNCALNIALDEVFFTKEPFENIFRFYRWKQKAYTIGYFQQNSDKLFPSAHTIKYPVVRRLTGGLAVLHDTDLSYSLIVSDDIWKYIYDQEKTYKIIHENIRKALEKIGIFSMYNVQCTMYNKRQTSINNVGLPHEKSSFAMTNKGTIKQNFSCVQTLYKDDLFLDGRKIVGSCQRRRGKRILVEGSIHLKLSEEQINIFTEDFFKNLSQELKCGIVNNSLTEEEINKGQKLCTEKYGNEKWNKLF